MSLITYILESCDGTLRYRVNFTGTTYLDVGETWNVECNGIPNGCYNVLENTNEVLDEYNGDECLFVEFESCEDCESTIDESVPGPTVTYLVWEYVQNCYGDNRSFTNPTNTDGSSSASIWYKTNQPYAGSDVIYFRNDDTGELKCFGRKNTSETEPEALEFYTDNVTAISGYTDCDECYSACTAQDIIIYMDPKWNETSTANMLEFEAMKKGMINLIESLQDKIYQGIVKVGIFKSPSSCSDNGSVIGLSENYNNILSAANSVSYFQSNDEYWHVSQWQSIYDNLVNGNESRDFAQASVIFLTDYIGGNYYAINVGDPPPYNEPPGCGPWFNPCDNTPDMEIVEWGCESCSLPFQQASNCGPRSWMLNVANGFKTGLFGGIGGKRVTWKIVTGKQIYEGSYSGNLWYFAQMVSGPQPATPYTQTENYFPLPNGPSGFWYAFSADTYQDVVDVTCELNEDPTFTGDPTSYDYYLTKPCCYGVEPEDLYVTVDSAWSPSVNTDGDWADGFEYNGSCYYFYSAVTSDYSGATVYTVASGDTTYRLCLDSNCCNTLDYAKFVNCCDSDYTIIVTYDTDIAGTPSSGDVIYTPGFEGIGEAGTGAFIGGCYEYLSPSIAPTTGDSHTYATMFSSKGCSSQEDFPCPDCPSPSLSQTPTPTQTPSSTTTPTPTPTNTPTQTPTPTPTPTPSSSTPQQTYVAQKFSACTEFEPNRIIPYLYSITSFTYNTVEYTIPLSITNVCDLRPLMDLNTVVSHESITAAAYYHFTEGTMADDAPWLLSEAGETSTVLAYQYWATNTTDYVLSGESSCQLPQVLYSTGNTISETGTTWNTRLMDRSFACLTYLGEVQTTEPLYAEINLTEYADCDTCLGLCNPQDIVVLMDQSTSVGSSNFNIMKDGVNTIANDLEDRMNFGEVRMGAIKWSTCNNTNTIEGLTSNHDTFTGSVENAVYQGGTTYSSQALETAYSMLSADNLSAEKSIILITDGYIHDFDNPNAACNTLTTSQLCTQMKMGTYGSGVQVKIYTVNIANGNNLQLNSLSSGDGFHFVAADFDDFVDNVANQIADNSCDENPIPSGSTYDYYQCSPCCTGFGLDDIIVSVDTGTTVNLGTDGFDFAGNCYTFESLTGDSFSAQTVDTISSGEIISNACSDPRCSCSNFSKYDLINCCDSNDIITITYSGTPTINSGMEYSGNCYSYKGYSGSLTPIGTFDSLVADICTSGIGCPTCASTSITPTQTPTNTPTPTNTQTPTVTPTPTPTNTPSNTITPTVTQSQGLSPSQTPTNTPTQTPSNTQTPTNTPSNTQTPTNTPTPTITPTRGTLLWLAENCCDGTDTLNVTLPTQSTKVFVFYDGTSLDVTKAEQASENIRAWYQDKVDGGDLSEGNLYEGFVGETSDNGENWLWWASYPYLGSLSGGTLSDGTVISEFNTAVDNSTYVSSYCKSSVGGCVPRDTEFNDGEDIYRRINRGYQLTGSYGVNDLRSNGVPFEHSLLTSGSTSGNGTFDGGISDYVVILVADESDGIVGFYHGKGTIDTLTTKGFDLYNTDVTENQNFLPNSGTQPTNRFIHDYESYLQVWNDIQTVGGRVNGIIYPVIDDNLSRIPFPLHCVGAIEGETISATDFQTEYGEPITSVGPENLNLSLVSNQNPYSSLSTNTVYTGLPLSYQNGPGLRHFGISVDPTVTDFSLGSITDTLDSFLGGLDVTNGYGFNIGGNCYFFVSQTTGVPDYELKWSQVEEDYCNTTPCICASTTPSNTPTPTTTPAATPSITPTPTPTPTQLPNCVSGTTTGSYRFTDCCGVEQIGSSLGVVYCVDTSAIYSGIDITYFECTPNCNEGPLEIVTNTTPDCTTTGSITVTVSSGTKPYLVQITSPSGIPPQNGNGPDFTFNGLSEGSYNITVSDSSDPIQSDSYSTEILGCFEIIIDNTENIQCNNSSGLISVSGNSNTAFPVELVLYKDGVVYSEIETNTYPYIFQGTIGVGTYYVVATDASEQVSTTSPVTITQNASIDYGISYTTTSQCGVCTGTASITGLTGTPPYTYQWSNGETGSSVNELCEGVVSVTVTDSTNCQNTQSVEIQTAPPLGISSYEGTQPDCFSCDGTITIQVTGGTTPYTYVGSNSQTDSNSSGEFTLTELCGGQYGITITDYNNCSLQKSYTLNSSSGINSVVVTPTDTTCGGNGEIKVDVVAIVGSITYSITGNTNGYTSSVTTNNQTYTFNNLEGDTYTVEVSLQSNTCSYTTTSVVNDEEKYTVLNTPTETTCGGNNGTITVTVSSGSTEIEYPLDYIITRVDNGLVVYSNINVPSNTVTANNIPSGSYEITVEDNGGCVSTTYTTVIDGTDGIQAILYGTNCVMGNDGTATLHITSGEAPYLVSWSTNVDESQRTDMYLTGLSGDTYTVTIFDSAGCTLQKTVTITCDSENVDDYVINPLCEQDFLTTSQGKRGFYEMLNEAFLDLNQSDLDCELDYAIFTGVLTISGGSYGVGATIEDEFYTGYTLNDVPSDNEWEGVVNGLLSNFTGITYTTDILNNVFTIKGDCDGDQDPTNGAYVELKAEIELAVDCDSQIEPSPSVTPSITPTNTVTPSITPTQGLSPTPTPTNTVTPSITVSPSVTPSVTITPTISVSLTPTPTPSIGVDPEAILFILEQTNNAAFAQYMFDSGSSFYGFGYNTQPSTSDDIVLFMDWPGWYDGTAPSPITQSIPQSSGGNDSYGNPINQYNFLTTEVPQGTATNAWYIWLIPQSMLGNSSNRQTRIQYNINSSSSSFVSQTMTSNIYNVAGNYTGSNWVNDTYRMYTTHPGQAFSINNNNTDDLYFKGGQVS